MCCETGETFNSASAAARAIGVGNAAIGRAAKQGGTSGGYHWEYVDTTEENIEEAN